MIVKDHLLTYIKSRPVLWRSARIIGVSTKGVVASAGTDICIEGFESSANSYTYNVIQYLGDNLSIAHHCHTPASVKIAVEKQVPTLILFRDPIDAIPSVVSRFRPNLYEAIISYIEFYETIITLKDSVMIVSFKEATQHTVQMISNIENKLDISFLPYDSFDNVDKAVKTDIREWKKKSKNPSTTPLPTESRELMKREIRIRMLQEPKYKQAAGVYRLIKKEYEAQKANNL